MSLQKLISKAQSLSQMMLTWKDVISVFHIDTADAIIASTIFGRVLRDLSLPFVIRMVSKEQLARELENDNFSTSGVFIGYSNGLSSQFQGEKIIWIVEPEEETEDLPQTLNGGYYGYLRPEATLSALSYFICDSIATSIDYIIQLPLIASQTGDQFTEYTGLTELIAQHAKSEDIISVSKSLAFPGSDTFSIIQSIMYSHKPFLPSLTGNERNVTKIVVKAGITVETSEGDRKISDLTPEEIADLNTALIVHLSEFKGHQEDKLVFVKSKTHLQREQQSSILHNTWDFGQAVVDACNRKQKGVVLGVLLGNRREKMSELQKLFQDEREALVSSVDLLLDKQDQIVELKHLRYFKAGENINWYNASLVAAMALSNGLVTLEKPFALIVKGPEDMNTLGIRSSRQYDITLDLMSLLSEVIQEEGIETPITGSSLGVQLLLPADKVENVLTAINQKLGDEK